MPAARVRIDAGQCANMAAEIRDLAIPRDQEEATENLNLEPDALANFYFVLVAICHQTSPRDVPPLAGVVEGKTLVGWDYLREAFALATRTNPRLVYPEALIRFQPSDLDAMMRAPDPGATLTDLVGRSALLHALGQRMIDLGWSTINDACRVSRGFINTGPHGPGLLDLLSGFTAYRDPVQKKSLFFLALMQNHGLWRYEDSETLGAPVDYHEVRGHLRYGTVVIEDADLAQAVEAGRRVDTAADVEIRSAVAIAIQRVAELTGHTPTQLHYFFWNVFRSCCRGQRTHSHECPPNCALPARYRDHHFVGALGRRCVVSRYCKSRDLDAKLNEHVADTDYY